jgi:hypothetical protein
LDEFLFSLVAPRDEDLSGFAAQTQGVQACPISNANIARKVAVFHELGMLASPIPL